MGVAVGRGRGDDIALLILLTSTTIDDGAAIGPGAQGRIAVGIGEGVVGGGQSELAILGEAAIYKYVFILDLTDAGGLEELETALLVASGDHILDDLGAGFDGGHRLGVELSSVGTLEPPVAIDTSVVVDKHGGVELQHTVHLIRIVLTPVADLEGTIGTRALGDEAIAETRLVVGEEVIGLLAVLVGYEGDVWCIEHIGGACGIKGLAIAVLIDDEDGAVVTPVVEAVDRCRPHHLIATAVGGDQIIVGAIDIDAVFAGLVGVFEDVRLTIGDVLPERHVGVAGGRELRVES